MKKKRLLTIISIIFMITVTIPSQGLPFSKETHQTINEHIALRAINGFSLNDYLLNELGFQNGVLEPLYGYSGIFNKDITQRVWKWLGEGGYMEDIPEDPLRLVLNKARNNNHFHNPLGGLWEYSGLNAYISLPFPLPPWLHYTGQSSILWAQNPNQDPGGRWSWFDARRYFYTALTGLDWNGYLIAPTQSDKNRYYANTFRVLGQLMHLIQDASVPPHSRNEIHTLYQKIPM